QFVVRTREFGELGRIDRDLDPAIRRLDPCATYAEKVTAQRTLQVDTKFVLLIERRRNRSRNQPQAALRRLQAIAPHREQTAELPAADQVLGQRGLGAVRAADHDHRPTLLVERVAHRQLLGVGAEYQRLTATDEDRQRTVTLRHRIDLDQR